MLPQAKREEKWWDDCRVPGDSVESNGSDGALAYLLTLAALAIKKSGSVIDPPKTAGKSSHIEF